MTSSEVPDSEPNDKLRPFPRPGNLERLFDPENPITIDPYKMGRVEKVIVAMLSRFYLGRYILEWDLERRKKRIFNRADVFSKFVEKMNPPIQKTPQ